VNDKVLVFDLECVPDVAGFARAENLGGQHRESEVRRQMGEKVARQLFQRIVCIGILSAHRIDGAWRPTALDTPHQPDKDERALIEDFARRLDGAPQLVTFNGHTFDLPVLRYRAMLHGVAMPGLAARPYFDRAASDTVDLCDLLSGQERHARASLDELARLLDLPGKPAGLDGAAVETMFAEGRHDAIAAYCRSDVINTWRCWLRYELFCGRLDAAQFTASEKALADFLSERG